MQCVTLAVLCLETFERQKWERVQRGWVERNSALKKQKEKRESDEREEAYILCVCSPKIGLESLLEML